MPVLDRAAALAACEPRPVPPPQPPQTQVDSAPSGRTNDPTPTFTFSSPDTGSSFECKVDSGSYSACSSPKTTQHLIDGPHTFYVRAKDSSNLERVITKNGGLMTLQQQVLRDSLTGQLAVLTNQIAPYNAVRHNSRPRGRCAPATFAPISINIPETKYRRHISIAGEKDSNATRIPRYVVPQKKHTQASAMRARIWEGD
jgi:hypothetical protein